MQLEELLSLEKLHKLSEMDKLVSCGWETGYHPPTCLFQMKLHPADSYYNDKSVLFYSIEKHSQSKYHQSVKLSSSLHQQLQNVLI